ncbi:MAG: Trigger factor [Patescibacteria group bacterium]|nr:Trigger factor [Patescibacteria group bacterium]
MNNIQIEKLPDSEIEITGEVPADIFMALWPTTLKRLAAKAEITGFRPGHAPEKIVLEKIGTERILFEMAEEILQTTYLDIIIAKKLSAIGEPAITITKIAKDNPLGFKIKTAVMPEFTLPDYKKIIKEVSAKHQDQVSATDDEVAKALEEIKQMRQKQDPDAKPVEIDDDFVKTLGDFSSVEDFKTKLKENILKDKQNREQEKRRLATIEEIGNQSNVVIPKLLIDNELDKMLAEMTNQIERMGLKFEDYLKHIKKTSDDLKTAWQDDAKKRVSFGLVVRAIADAEKIKPEHDTVHAEINHILSHNPELKGKVAEDRIHAYVENVMTSDLVMKFLDGLK